MASTQYSNPYASAATAAIASTAQLEEQKLLLQAMQNVLQQDNSLKLSLDIQNRFRSSRTFAEFLSIFDGLRRDNKALKPLEASSKRHKLAQYAGKVLLFKDYGKAVSQFNQAFATPIWSLLSAALTTIQNFPKTDEALLQIDKRLHRFSERQALLFKCSPSILTDQIRDQLLNFYEIVIKFGFQVAAIFERTTSDAFFEVISGQLLQSLKEFSESLPHAANDVDQSVSYATCIAVDNLRQSNTFNSAPPQSQLVPSISATTSRCYHVPQTLNRSFSGRNQALQDIYRQLNQSHTDTKPSQAVIHGIAGVGKTQTALKFAETNKLSATGGTYESILFVRASDKTKLLAEYCNVARELGVLKDSVDAQKYKDMVISKVKRWLEFHPKWLFIFDNVTNSADVLPYLPEHGDGHILFTTRSSIIALRLASRNDITEIRPMSMEESTELALKLAPVAPPFRAQDTLAAEVIAGFSRGLPLVIEQIINFGEASQIGWTRVMESISNKMDLLKKDTTCSYHEDEWSAWAILATVLDHLQATNPKSAELFKLLVFFDHSAIPLTLLHGVKDDLLAHFKRELTYERGARDPVPRHQIQVETSGNQSTIPKTRLLSSEWIRQKVRGGKHNTDTINVEIPRTDSRSDVEMHDLWNSSDKRLQLVFENDENLDSAINSLENIGIVRRFNRSCLWIHDLFAQIGRDFVERDSIRVGRSTAHLAGTMVYLKFPTFLSYDYRDSVDKAMECLPHAMACQGHLKRFQILNDTTIGPELSHLIASTMDVACIIYSRRYRQLFTRDKLIAYYRDAYHGYLNSWKRAIQVGGITWHQLVLSTVADFAQERLRGYSPSRHIGSYERFGSTALWRCISTTTRIGYLLSYEGNNDESATFLKNASKFSEMVFGRGNVDTLAIKLLLINTYMKQERWQEAHDVAWARAVAFMNPEPEDYIGGDIGPPITLGLRDTLDGGEIARTIGTCCMEIPGYERRAVFMFENELAAKEHVWGKGSGYCCGALQRLSKAWKKAGDLHKSLFWQAWAVGVAMEDSDKYAAGSMAVTQAENYSEIGGVDNGEFRDTATTETAKPFVYGQNMLRVLDNQMVDEIVAEFRRVRLLVDDPTPQLLDQILRSERLIELWELCS